MSKVVGERYLPTEPIREFLLKKFAEKERLEESYEVPNVQGRVLRRIMYEGQKQIGLSFVDEVLINMGESPATLYELYPILEEE